MHVCVHMCMCLYVLCGQVYVLCVQVYVDILVCVLMHACVCMTNYSPFCFREFPSELIVLTDITVGLFLTSM